MPRLLPVLFLMLLSACVTSRPRPADWPTDVVVTSVQQVEGNYAPAGVLARLIEAEEASFDPVRIAAEGDALAFEFMLRDGTAKKVLRRYALVDGWVEVGAGDGSNRDGVLGYEKHRLALRPDAKGALIVRTRTTAVGVVLLIPVAGSQSGWARLERVSPQEAAATLTLAAADLETVAKAWQANFGEAAHVSERAKALGVRVNLSARTRGDFRRQAVAALRAQGVVIGGHPDGGVLFSAEKGDAEARRRAR